MRYLRKWKTAGQNYKANNKKVFRYINNLKQIIKMQSSIVSVNAKQKSKWRPLKVGKGTGKTPIRRPRHT
jgi:hypothetical protein